VLAVGIGAVALSAGAGWSPVLGIVGAPLAVAALVYQYRSAGPVAFSFVEGDWVTVGEGYEYAVARAHHGRRTPSVIVLRATANGFEEIACGVETNAEGDVRLSIAACPFAGQVRIS
jgi:hypothetical protein